MLKTAKMARNGRSGKSEKDDGGCDQGGCQERVRDDVLVAKEGLGGVNLMPDTASGYNLPERLFDDPPQSVGLEGFVEYGGHAALVETGEATAVRRGRHH